MQKKSVNIRRNIGIILFFVLTVLLFGPLGLFLSNAEEFWFSLTDLLKVIIPVSLAVIVVFTILFLLLPRKAARIAGMLLLGISIGCYLQGHFLNISYGTGLLDGTPVDWNEYTTYGIINTIIWIVCIAVPFVIAKLMKNKWKKVFRLFTFISILFIAIQIPSLVIQVINYRPNLNLDIQITKKGQFELAPQENIIIFIVDTLDEAYYQDFLKSEPEYVENLNGFVHYDNTLASGSRTTLAVPSMFTGIPYVRGKTYSEYKNEVWGKENSLSLLAKDGYDVGFYTEPQLFSTENIKYFSNFEGGGTEVGFWDIFVKKIYKLDFFKYSPHYLKWVFYLDTAEFDQAIDVSKNQAYVIRDAVFYKDYREQHFSVHNEYKKTVRIYHLRGTHSPYVLSANATSDSKATLQDTTAGNFHGISEMLDDLREKGLYDSATIIITADHGDRHFAEQPIFLLKEAYSTEPYRDDHSPVSLFDLPIFLADHIGKTLDNQVYGEHLFSLYEGMERERHFFAGNMANKSVVTNEYMTTGLAGDRDAIVKVQTYYDNKGADTPYYLGTKLTFDMDATGNYYLVEGAWFNNGWRTRIFSDYGKMQFPIMDLPKNGELHVWIELNNNRVDNLDFTIFANGNPVYKNTTGKELCASDIDFNVPVSYITDGKTLTLEFYIDNVTQEILDNKGYSDQGIISMTSMLIEKAK